MKRTLTTAFIMFLFCVKTYAQQKFIKATNTSDFGSVLRILPTADKGWRVFSKDSLKLAKFNSCGQVEWCKKYNVPNTEVGLSDFIQTQNGDLVFLTRMKLTPNIYLALVTRIDAQGNILWSKSYEDAIYSQFPYTVSEDNQGNIFLFANVENTNDNSIFNLISKIDANGNLFWTRYYDHGWVWGGAIVTSDNGLLIRTGTNFIKIDNAGNVQWQSQFLSVGYHYLAPVEVSDGYIFTGYITGSQIVFGKMDKSGNLLWNGRKTSDFGGNPPHLRKKSNGNFTGMFSKTVTGQNYSTIIEFDKDLNVVNQNSFDNPGVNLYGIDISFTVDNAPIVTGLAGSIMFIAKLDNDYKSYCDHSLASMTFTVDPATQSFVNTNVFNYTLNEVSRNYTVDTFSVLMSPLCFQPKFLELGNDTILCEHAAFTLQNKNADVFDSYLWSTGDTTPAISVTQPGTYWLHATYNCGENEAADTIMVTVTPVTSAELGDDLYICEDSTETLTAPPCASCNYTWSTGSTLSTIDISEQGTYWLSIDNTNGCITSDTIEAFIVKCDCSFYVPNAFTPDGDGLNDLFNPLYDCDFNDYSMQIFNRWGQLVYTTESKEAAWDGRFNNVAVPQGVYLYIVSYQPILKGKVKSTVTKSGTVAVIY